MIFDDCEVRILVRVIRGNVVVDVTTLKMARKPVKIQRKVQQDALGNRTV